MKPSKFIKFQERRLGRPLTKEEMAAIEAARLGHSDSKRDAVKAMWAALEQSQSPKTE